MKRYFKFIVPLLLILPGLPSYAQFTKEKLSGILTNGSQRDWFVKSKSNSSSGMGYQFHSNNTVYLLNSPGKEAPQKWSLSSTDNIRWFITMGKIKNEIIVSYDKAGKQFIKLTNQTGNGSSSYNEIILYPSK